MSGIRADINLSLISAVRGGRLESARELINSFGLSYSPAWSDGYALLCEALKNEHAAISKLLLTGGSKVNDESKAPSVTPLHLAVINGDIEIVKIILDKGANIEAEDQYGRTPLNVAIENEKVKVTEFLLKHTARVNARSRYNDGAYPLHVAAEIGCLQIIDHLLKYGADINCVLSSSSACKKGYTPLHLAAENGRKDIVTLLLSRGANVDVKGEDDITPLHIAARKGYICISEDFLNHGACTYSLTLTEGYTPLHFASELDNEKAVKLFLDRGSDINASTKGNLSPLHIATIKGHKTVVKLLLQRGANVDNQDDDGKTALHLAVENACFLGFQVSTLLHAAATKQQEEIAKLLISYEADINAQDKTGKTPIFYAIKNNDLKITKLLLNNRANIKDTPELLNIAVKKECKEIVEALLQHDADVNATDKYGRTALHFTAFSETIFGFWKYNNDNIKGEIAKLLLTKGANADAKTKNGIKTLHRAVQKGYKEVVKVLLESGAKVDSKIKKDIKLLHFCAKKGYQEIIETLLKFGADINSKDKHGRTALHIASQQGHSEVVATLLEYGSDINIISKNNHTALECAIAGIRFISSYHIPDFHINNSNDYYLHSGLGVSSREATAKALILHIVKIKTANLYEKCKKEIASIKSEKINLKISFYDILAKDTISLAMYMRNENTVQVLNSEVYKTKFPIYASMIGRHFRKAMERKEIYEQSYKIFHFLINNCHELPYYCTEKIFSYLSNEDLRIFTDACKSLNICNTKDINFKIE